MNVPYSMGQIAGEDAVSFYSERAILLGHVMRHVLHLEIMHLPYEIALSSPSGAAISKIVFLYLPNIGKLMYPSS